MERFIEATFPHYQQHDSMDCGSSCLRMIARYHSRTHCKPFATAHTSPVKAFPCWGSAMPRSPSACVPRGVRINFNQLVEEATLHCILRWNQNHFVVLYVIGVAFPDGLLTNYRKTLPMSQEITGSGDVITDDLRLIERFFTPMKKIFNGGISD